MTEPFIAEIRMLACNFPPAGWAFCNGQVLPIRQNTALFSILGTTYGGDGKTTFALPDLQGATPMQWGQGRGLSPHDIGEAAGQSGVTLTPAELPAHTHTLQASSHEATLDGPGPQNSLGRSNPGMIYKQPAAGATPRALAAGTLGPPVMGGSQPHNNMMPFGVLNFCIALQGIFPPRP